MEIVGHSQRVVNRNRNKNGETQAKYTDGWGQVCEHYEYNVHKVKYAHMCAVEFMWSMLLSQPADTNV